jgi:hypothetical protein
LQSGRVLKRFGVGAFDLTLGLTKLWSYDIARDRETLANHIIVVVPIYFTFFDNAKSCPILSE